MGTPWTHAARRTAKALGGRRVVRQQYESAPDIEGVEGMAVEVKHRARLPVLVTSALAKARKYAAPGGIAVAVLYQKGARDGVACLRLADLVRLRASREET